MGSDDLGRELAPIAIMILAIVMTFVWTADLMIQSTIDMPRGEFFELLGSGSLEPA
jgi:hypothetical protein